MGHSVHFFKFDQGLSCSMDEPALKSLFREFNLEIAERHEDTSIVTDESESIGSQIRVGYEGLRIMNVSIERPRYTERFYELAAHLIIELGLCMFPSFGGVIYHSENFNCDDNLPDGFLVDRVPVSGPEDLKE